MTNPLDRLDTAQLAALRHWSGRSWQAPCLASTATRAVSGPDWVFERKWDGVRIVSGRSATSNGADEVRLWTRAHRSANGAYPEVADALREQPPAQFVLDGEIIAVDGEGPSFARLQQRMHITDERRARASEIRVEYRVFDLLALDGVDLTGLPLHTRKELLAACFDFAEPIRMSQHRTGDGHALLRDACSRGWEGLIAKRIDGSYRSGRTREWLKLKCVAEQEFVVGGFTEPSGSRTGFGALVLGQYSEHGDLRYAGKVGTGYDESTLRWVRALLEPLRRRDSPFVASPAVEHVHWVRPDLVVRVGFSEWTPDGRLRHGRFRGVVPDKAAADVRREPMTRRADR